MIDGAEVASQMTGFVRGAVLRATKRVRAGLGVAVLGLLAGAVALAAGGGPTAPGGDAPGATERWNFRVLLDGKPIGVHRFTLQQDGARRTLQTDAQFDVKLLFFSAYRYRHEALEQWEGDCVATVATDTDTNGERQSVRARTQGASFVVESGGRREVHEGADRCAMTFAYWNPRILDARRLLNTQTGELMPVTIATLGDERISVRGHPVTAARYRITATDLSIDVWYADRRWVALESLLKNGRRLRYELM